MSATLCVDLDKLLEGIIPNPARSDPAATSYVP